MLVPYRRLIKDGRFHDLVIVVIVVVAVVAVDDVVAGGFRMGGLRRWIRRWH